MATSIAISREETGSGRKSEHASTGGERERGYRDQMIDSESRISLRMFVQRVLLQVLQHSQMFCASTLSAETLSELSGRERCQSRW